ncbi:MAG: sugar ABC transporter permease [Lachnospiraceae bacterium]|jgi:multiple sugar transport system permease protein|nr:sugar ABC transporter permease [Lachnospiraceae bacterium]
MQKKRTRTGILLALPVLLGTAAFFLIPFFLMIRYSLADVPGGGGWKNYVMVLQSGTFRTALFNTLRFIVIGVSGLMLLSTGLAVLIRKKIAGVKLLSPLLLFPMMIPTGAVVMFVEYLLSETGLLNQVLVFLGREGQEWMASSSAFVVLLVMYLWRYAGYGMILIMAGWNTIPKQQEESAALDGAKGWQSFWRVVFPQLTPVLFFVVVISVVNSFKIYREAFLLGGERPDRSIYMLQHFLNNNFDNLNYPRLSAATLVTFVGIFGLTAALYQIQKKAGETL